jgi:uncharacterized NAD(P)/FAD-binding protein YdhS
MRTLCIVGAGFSGTATAIHLLQKLEGTTTRVVLVDSRADAGSGVAYETRDYPYLLNVPAGQMSVDPTRPRDFFDFARARRVKCVETDFLPRALYGEYLKERLQAAIARAPANVHFSFIRAQITGIGRANPHSRWRLTFDDGREMFADRVVLALGNPPPSHLPQLRAIENSRYYVHDPWNDSEESWSAPRVLLVGTSLTMADVAMRLIHDPTPPISITCLSRHGYLPLRQTTFDRSAARPEAVAEIEAAGSSLRRLFRVVHALGDETEARGGDWREIVTIVRRRIPQLWKRLSERDRRRFLRHVRSVWDKHRHRLPHTTLDEIMRMRRTGLMEIQAGSLVDARIAGEEVEVCWRPRGRSEIQTLTVDRVINCTGPDYNVTRSDNPLVRQLLSSGFISPDRLFLGIRTTARYEVVGANGRPVPGLHYIGPWLRARHWEATAVAELRAHAAQLATLIARGRDPHPRPTVTDQPHVERTDRR